MDRWERLTPALAPTADGWRFWLCPWRQSRSLSWDELDRWDRKRVELLETHRHGLDLLSEASLLAERIRQAAQDAESALGLRDALSNRTILDEAGGAWEALFIRSGATTGDLVWAAAAWYKALSLFLGEDRRFVRWDASIAFAFVTWQWYSLVKSLAHTPTEREDARRMTEYELALAHRVLASALEDPDLGYGFANLWRMGRGYRVGGAPAAERLRMSLPLSTQDTGSLSLVRLQPAPGCFDSRALWEGSVGLHPSFQHGAGAQAVRRLIIAGLLPAYNLADSLQLASLLRRGKELCWGWRVLTWVPSLGILATLLCMLLEWHPEAGLVLFGISFLLFFAAAALRLDGASLPHLALPRLLVGIGAGYLPLVLAGDSWRIAALFAPGGPGQMPWRLSLCLLWGACLLIAMIYLWLQALGSVGDAKEAAGRAGLVLGWGTTASFAIGLLVIHLAWPVYEATGLNLAMVLTWGLGEVVLPALLAFAPLALLIGIMTQFALQREPVTASIWSPKQP